VLELRPANHNASDSVASALLRAASFVLRAERLAYSSARIIHQIIAFWFKSLWGSMLGIMYQMQGAKLAARR
jgi:hypothetical protein